MDVPWLINRLRSLGKNRIGLANALGVQPSAISRVISGRRSIKSNEVVLMATYLEVTPDFLLQKIVVPTQPDAAENWIASDEREAQRSAGAAEQFEQIWGSKYHKRKSNESEPKAAFSWLNEVAGGGYVPMWRESHALDDVPVIGLGSNPRADHWLLVLDRVPRPLSLASVVEAYALYVNNDDMAPRYRAGEVVFTHPRKPVTPNSYAVFMHRPLQNPEKSEIFLGEFIDKDDAGVRFRQLATMREMTIAPADLVAMHRIVLAGEP